MLESTHVTINDVRLGMLSKGLHLLLDFVWRQKIICVQQLDELSVRLANSAVVSTAIEQVLLSNVPDAFAIDRADFRRGFVGGFIVDNDGFGTWVGLTESTVDCELKVRPIVVGDNDDRNQRCGHSAAKRYLVDCGAIYRVRHVHETAAPRGCTRGGLNWAMGQTPLVSVITIFFNEQRFLSEAVESVTSQSVSDWELLLVDDGSSDQSTFIAQQFAMSDPARIKYLSHDGNVNRGMAASRNLGLSRALGEFVTFLDADDVWLPERLELQLAEARDHPEAEMICGASTYWSSWQDSEVDDFVVQMGGRHGVLLRPPELSISVHPLGAGAAPCVSAVLVRRSLFERLGGFADEFRGFYEDQTFLAKAYLGATVLITSTVCDKYRQHPESCSAQALANGTARSRRFDFLLWLERYLDDQRIQDEAVRKLLGRELEAMRHPRVSALKRRISGLLKSPPPDLSRPGSSTS